MRIPPLLTYCTTFDHMTCDTSHGASTEAAAGLPLVVRCAIRWSASLSNSIVNATSTEERRVGQGSPGGMPVMMGRPVSRGNGGPCPSCSVFAGLICARRPRAEDPFAMGRWHENRNGSDVPARLSVLDLDVRRGREVFYEQNEASDPRSPHR